MVFKWIKKSFSNLFKSKRRRKTVKKKRRKAKPAKRRVSRRTVRRFSRKKPKAKKTAPRKRRSAVRSVKRPQRIQAVERQPEIPRPQAAADRFYPRRAYFPSLSTVPERQVRPAAAPVPTPSEVKIGTLSHYFSKILVGVVTVENPFKQGDSIEIRRKGIRVGKEVVKSMQINHIPIENAKKGEEIGLKLKTAAQVGDEIYKI